MRRVYQINDIAGNPIDGHVMIAPTEFCMDSMLAELLADIAPNTVAEVASEDELILPEPAHCDVFDIEGAS
jgi:hypothetical protein